MNDDSLNVQKWTCEYCTYANYPSALKCTMCRGAKPLLNEDIFRLRDDSPSTVTCDGNTAPMVSGPSIGNNHSDGKWTCPLCTFLNRSGVKECSECGNVKTLALSTSTANIVTASDLHEHLKPLRIDQTSTNEAGSVISTTRSSGHVKWSCLICTYENWPKAYRCVMCGAAPRISPQSTINIANEAAVEDNDVIIGRTQVHRSNYNSNHNSASGQLQHSPVAVERNGSNSTVEDGGINNMTVSLKRSSSRRLDDCSGGGGVGLCLGGVGGGAPPPRSPPNNLEYERRMRLHRHHHAADWPWLNACLAVVQGDPSPVEAYLSSGGDPARQLSTSEVAILNRPSAFDVGYTLVHLAIRFHREDLLATLLSRIEGSGSGVKRVPSYVAPDLAADIRRHAASIHRQRKASLPIPFFAEWSTFTLPAEIEDLPASVQEQLFEELLDKDAQQQLEADPPVINWSLEITVHLGSRLYALWNRSAGDCLLDSLMQATWGVFDRDNLLRRMLSDSLNQAGHLFYSRWREYESCQARLMHFSLEETQWEEDWSALVALASRPGNSLEQLHVFALAHILRRPVIVYGVKYVKSFRGEDLGYARFEGVYLPLLWDRAFCIRSPLALGYTRGHFSALVPIEPYPSADTDTGAHPSPNDHNLQVTILPLMDHDRKLLPVHFVTQSEMGTEESLLRQWLDVCVTEGGLLVAQQRLQKRPLLVAQMVEEWLNHYRRLAQMSIAPFSRTIPVQDYSSDGDTDDE